MRVILDANIIISYLLSRKEGGMIRRVVEACFLQPEIQLVFPQELRQELIDVWARKAYLHTKIPRHTLDAVLDTVAQIAEVPPLVDEVPAQTRDAKDDYLIAYGLVEQIDYLVTGDEDLTVLKQIRGLKLVNPIEFLQILELNQLQS
jgi:uncharacterized protein